MHLRAPGCAVLCRDPVHVEARLFRLEIPFGQVEVQEAAEGGDQYMRSRLGTSEQHDSEEA